MKIRAVICDIYHTLLAVKPPPEDAEARWLEFWESIPGMERQLSLADFSAAVREITAREHAAARATGVAHPEILWPDVLNELVPEFEKLSPEVREELFWQQAQHLHTVSLMPGAADALRKMKTKGFLLGLASNSQPYTLRELDVTLGSVALSREFFDPTLCFYSFEHGFSKPDPAVFRFLAERLQARGIPVSEAVMIGNRLDNDIAPAQAEGWQTWHLTEQASTETAPAGNWKQFSHWLG